MAKYKFEKSETLTDLFDNAHDLIHVLEPDGRIVYVNAAWEKVLGYKEEEVKGRSIYSLLRPEDQQWFREYREDVLGGRKDEGEVVFGLVTKGGDLVYVEGFVSPKLLKGEPLYTRGIFRDVTTRLRNEAELKSLHAQLKEREANLQNLFFYAPDAVVVIDAQSIIRYWNPKAEKIFGWTQDEVLGKHLADVIVPEQYREAHIEGMKRYLATGEAHVLNKTIEITSMHKSGHEFFVALTISATLQEGAVAFIAFIRDIHEHKLNARELDHKRMQLEVSNQQLEQFAHVASHDMKEPVRKILLFADLLQSETEASASEKSRSHLRKIIGAATRLASMVDGVLNSSILKAEEVTHENVDLNKVLADIGNDLDLLFESKKATISYSDLPVVEGGAFLMYQLFYNLINNSLKFSRPGVPARIEISSRRVPAGEVIAPPHMQGDGPWIEISVKDNGIGFPQHQAETIFKTFSRLHPKDKYEGTGIGLSLCKSIVEKHDGFMRAEGKVNEGATFRIYLPERRRA